MAYLMVMIIYRYFFFESFNNICKLLNYPVKYLMNFKYVIYGICCRFSRVGSSVWDDYDVRLRISSHILLRYSGNIFNYCIIVYM